MYLTDKENFKIYETKTDKTEKRNKFHNNV